MNRIIIAPSIIASNFLHLDQVVATCERAGADWLHVDVMDGRFVPNITVGPFVVAAVRRATKLPLDVHLMIEEPERYLEDFAKAGATNLTVHVETCPQLEDTLDTIKKLGCKAGVTLNPSTPVSKIEPVLHHADLVLILSVNPGFSGQEFMPETITKVEQVRKKLDELGSQEKSRCGYLRSWARGVRASRWDRGGHPRITIFRNKSSLIAITQHAGAHGRRISISSHATQDGLSSVSMRTQRMPCQGWLGKYSSI